MSCNHYLRNKKLEKEERANRKEALPEVLSAVSPDLCKAHLSFYYCKMVEKNNMRNRKINILDLIDILLPATPKARFWHPTAAHFPMILRTIK